MPNRTLLELNTQTSPFSLHSCGQKGLGRLIEEEIAHPFGRYNTGQ